MRSATKLLFAKLNLLKKNFFQIVFQQVNSNLYELNFVL